MARFYATIQGNRGRASRMGSAYSGLTSYTAGWQGAVRTTIYDQDGVDYVTVSLVPWQGAGVGKILYDGPVDARKQIKLRKASNA